MALDEGAQAIGWDLNYHIGKMLKCFQYDKILFSTSIYLRPTLKNNYDVHDA